MTRDELVAAVLERGGDLVLRGGRLRYYGPPLATDDPIRAAVREHRDELVRLLTPAPRRAPRFEPGPPYFELVPGRRNVWRETPWAATRCIYGDGPLADGERLRCPAHSAEASDLVQEATAA